MLACTVQAVGKAACWYSLNISVVSPVTQTQHFFLTYTSVDLFVLCHEAVIKRTVLEVVFLFDVLEDTTLL